MTDRTAKPDLLRWIAGRHVPDPEGHGRTRRHRHPDAVRQDRQVHLRPGLPVDRLVQFDDHLHRRRQGRAPLPRLSDRGARGEVRLHGSLPPAALRRAAEPGAEDGRSSGRVIQHTMVNEQMQAFLRGFRRDAHPMAVMTGLVGALSAFYPDSINLHDAHQRDISAIRLIAKMPTLVAMAYKYSVGQPYMYPRNDLSYAANFMRMMFATPCEDYKVERRAGAGDGPDLHPARRPRAERVDVDGAAVRVVGHQPVRGDRRGRRLPVGPGARRRERGLPQHARRHPGAAAAWRRSANSSPRSRTRTAPSS